jgi:hypothetical protein
MHASLVMKKISLSVVNLCLLTFPSLINAATVVNSGTISAINGPSALDLTGEIVHAINFSADDPARTVRYVRFTPDSALAPGLTIGPNNVTPWFARPDFGVGADEGSLAEIFADIRWADAGAGETLQAHLPVVAGETYKLQILVYGNKDENRRWDIEVEGVITVDEITSLGASDVDGLLPVYAPDAGVVYTLTVTAGDNTLDVRMGDLGDFNDGGDRNPIWQAITVEHLVPDTDSDGLPDAWEILKFAGIGAQTGAGDAEADGLSNQAEYQLGTNPASEDSDTDGLTDLAEYTVHGTNPAVADTDGDTLTDGAEVNTHLTNPLSKDSDLDGLADNLELTTYQTNPKKRDTDNDDYDDGFEVEQGTDPKNAAAYPLFASRAIAITGADPGEGLDLSGTFLYAFNVGTNGAPGMIGNVNFTDEANNGAPGITISPSGDIPAWGAAPDLGASPDDDALEVVLASIRYAGANGGKITITLTGLTPGRPYKLQLMFLERCCNRGMDILVDDVLKLDEFAPYTIQDGTTAPTRAAGAVIGFVAAGNSTKIVVDGSNVTTAAYTDRNPILNGLTLEAIPPGADLDGDGLDDNWERSVFGNLAETGAGDFDNDGLTNLPEYNLSTDPKDADSDDDNLTDGVEVNLHTTNPRAADTDLDGLNDGAEINLHLTNPKNADSDADGYNDAAEVAQGTNPNSAAVYPALGAMVGFFTGGDAGEGLDLTGTFPYAFNVGTPGSAPGPVQEVNFTEDTAAGITVTATNEIPNWNAPAYGDTANDDNLEFILQSIRYSGAPNTVNVDLAGLTAGKAYKLQLLFAEQGPGRGFDIEVEGILLVDEFSSNVAQKSGGNSRGAVVTIGFIATDDTLNVVLTGNGVTTPVFGDHNPILSGVTLEEMNLANTDGDNLPDVWELQYFGNLSQNDNGNPDADGLTNLSELIRGTNPSDPDSDDDTLNDGAEVDLGTNPLVADTDGDGLGDGAEVNVHHTDPVKSDTDDDQFSDRDELIAGTNPLVGTSFPNAVVGLFTGGDEGEGLDLDGSFLYAFNVGTPGAAGQARDANFTADSAPGITLSTVNQIPNWHNPVYGDTNADNVVEKVMQSIRWTPAPGTVGVNLDGLVAGKPYKLQLLFAETGSARGFDVLIEGGMVLNDLFPGTIQGAVNSQATVVAYEFTATDTQLNIVLNGNTTAAPDKNPILSGLTLEAIGSAPADPKQIEGIIRGITSVTINAAGLPGKTYSIDYSANLISWIEANDSFVPAANGSGSWTDTAPSRTGAGAAKGYYRLRDPALKPTP